MMEWRDIKGYEGVFQISNTGLVKGLARSVDMGMGRTKFIKERFIKVNNDPFGYRSVQLCFNGVCKTKMVHKLIAIAFIPNPHNYEVINHKNGIKHDNRIGNLEWCTSSYNNTHAIHEGLRKLYTRKIIDTKNNCIYDSIIEAANAIGVNKNTLGHWLRGRMQNKSSLIFHNQ